MRIHRRLVAVVICYLLLFVIINLIFSVIYYQVAISNKHDQASYFDWLYFSMLAFVTISFDDVNSIPITQMRSIVVIHHLIFSIIIPITSGLIFYFILNRPPKIIFPKQLVLRRRTSEGSRNVLTLSLKIGNKDRHKIYDIKCQLIYFYYKELNGNIARNGETNFVQYIPYIDKTFRFSYELDKFPSVLLKTLLDRQGVNHNDMISIIIYGRFGKFGDSFMVERDYFLKDIIIAKDTKLLYKYEEIDEDKFTKTPINFENLNEIVHYPENERKDVIEQMRNLILKKEKEERIRLNALNKK